jgi:hypothetical protein
MNKGVVFCTRPRCTGVLLGTRVRNQPSAARAARPALQQEQNSPEQGIHIPVLPIEGEGAEIGKLTPMLLSRRPPGGGTWQ